MFTDDDFDVFKLRVWEAPGSRSHALRGHSERHRLGRYKVHVKANRWIGLVNDHYC